MYRVNVISALLLWSLTFGAGSCARVQTRAGDVDLLSTGLVGWQQIGGQGGAWRIEEGVLSIDEGSGGWLATHRQYGNFVLSLDYRISPAGNSCVFIRAPLEGDPAYTGLEIQIVDDYAERPSPLESWQYTGSLYGVQAPSNRVSKQAGQWQTMVIVARGPRIQVELNGTKIVDADLTNYTYLANTHPGLTRTSGYVGLQSHGSRVEFRNIRIRELPER